MYIRGQGEEQRRPPPLQDGHAGAPAWPLLIDRFGVALMASQTMLCDLGPQPALLASPAPHGSWPGLNVFCVVMFIWPRDLESEETGWGAPLSSPKTDRMALSPKTMGSGRGQVLDLGQEKDNGG